jgi:hypothetical protein
MQEAYQVSLIIISFKAFRQRFLYTCNLCNWSSSIHVNSPGFFLRVMNLPKYVLSPDIFQSQYQTWTRLTRRISLVEQELLTLLEHLNSPPVFSGVRVTRSLVLYVCFVDRCLSFYTFSFSHRVVCSSSIYGFWLPPFGIFKLFLWNL